MAVGYGPNSDGEINAPPYWGKTSWLVMGSGGQVSTAEDMWRWAKALRSGKLLSETSLKAYGGTGGEMLAGGDMYGFEIMYAGDGQSFMVVMSNAGSPKRNPEMRRLAQDLAGLIRGRAAAKFTLGIQLAVEDKGAPKIADVIPGGAAAKAGLREGDILLKAAGKSLSEDPMATLGQLLQSGETIEFEIERAGARLLIKVQPQPR
jgi:hypothetical protein